MNCQELFDQLNALDEHPRIDAKTASEVSSSVMETICAYSNEPGLGGGYLLLGVRECDPPQVQKYCVVEIENPDKIQQEIANQCAARFNRVIRPECFVESLEGKPVIGVFIPEAQPGDKPVYFKKVGLPRVHSGESVLQTNTVLMMICSSSTRRGRFDPMMKRLFLAQPLTILIRMQSKSTDVYEPRLIHNQRNCVLTMPGCSNP